MWAAQRHLFNVKFFQDNAESTHFPPNYFDIVHFAYVLHEMPERNANLVLKEIRRLLRSGGVLSGFEGKEGVHVFFFNESRRQEI